MEGILSEVLSFIAGLVAGFTLKIGVDSRRQTTTTKTTQKGNTVGGHQAGRDVNSQDR